MICRIPLLTKNGFAGRVICTRATAAACEYLLKDSAKIQESDADYLNYKVVRNFISRLKPSKENNLSPQEIKDIKKRLKNKRQAINSNLINELMQQNHLDSVQPLYTSEDAEQALTAFDGRPYKQPIKAFMKRGESSWVKPPWCTA